MDASSNRLSGVPYDVTGNVLARDTKGYTYDSVGMLESVEEYMLTVRFLYTADDERIVTFPNDTQTRITLRDFNGKVLRELSATGGTLNHLDQWVWEQDFVYAAGQLVGADREAYYGGRRHFHLDHLGSVRMITNSQTLRLGRHDYYPFGTERTSSVQEVTNFGYDRPSAMKFTGHERDFRWLNADHIDYLDYMHARYYDSSAGRFLSVDPIQGDPEEPQSWNRYSYVRNNPLNFTDPTGMCGEPADFVGPTLPCDIDFAEEIEVTAEAPGIIEHIEFIAEETTAEITPFGPLPGSAEGLWSAYQDRQFLKANPDWKPDILTGTVMLGPGFRISNLRYLQGGRLLRGNVTQTGGVSAARAQFERLTGRAPVGATDSAKLADGTVVKFRAVGRSGGAKVEINDPRNGTYQKTTFND